MQIIWRTAMSMDGKVATRDHDLSFLETIADPAAARDEFPSFLDGIDGILVGAQTVRWLLLQGHGWPHGDKPTWIVSHDTSLPSFEDLPHPPTRVEGDLATIAEQVSASGARRVWLAGGGNLAGQLLQLDLIDEVEVAILPTVVGAGPSLFGEGDWGRHRFSLVECCRFAGNAVKIRWQRQR